jgi:uncharacterized OB-fold protein
MATYQHLGMELRVSEQDTVNTAYFAHCAAGRFSLQRCEGCQLLHYPPSAGCPWCGSGNQRWDEVDARGTVYSYSEVQHAVQPGFAPHAPYMVLLVELDTQRGQPTADEAIRVLGNLVNPDGTLAAPEDVARVGIGTRVRMAFTRLGERMALPQWTIDEDAVQPAPWRPEMKR